MAARHIGRIRRGGGGMMAPRQPVRPPSDFTTLGGSNEFAGLETFASPDVHSVTMTSDEVTALCPVTGQPDWYTVEITYEPHRLCLESKSLKLYLNTFRQRGEFVESLAAILVNEIGDAVQPHQIDVVIRQKPRGGIGIVAHAARSYQL